MFVPRLIVLHHTASPTDTTVADVDRWHRARGWRGIGYHYLVHRTPYGWVASPGRSPALPGAHCRGDNHRSLGVAVAGDYEAQPMDPGARAALVRLLAELMKRHGLTVADVYGHRERPGQSTACPGRYFDLDGVRADLMHLVLGGDR